MAIRSKNIDYNSDQMKLSVQVVSEISATVAVPIFAAPYACKVVSVDVYPESANTFTTSQTNTLTVRIVGASDSTLGVRTTALSAAVLNAISLSANNSLSTGAALELMYSSTCQTLNTCLIAVKYVPLTHRESR